uniref:Putative secreted protein n=1 Tax=Rhipicephalus microplus TaxID=6941 RepID=A0A6G5A4T2_RHIMP
MRRIGHSQYWWLFVATTVCLHVIGLCMAQDKAKRNIDSAAGSAVDVQRLSRVLSDIAYAGKLVKDALSKAWQSVRKLKIFQRKTRMPWNPLFQLSHEHRRKRK